MSLEKVSHQFRTVLDLSEERVSRHKVHNLLKQAEVLYTDASVYIENEVRIGAYNIRLILGSGRGEHPDRLRNYGRFNIRLYEMKLGGLKEIDPAKDVCFKSNDWAKKNDGLTISDLVDVILFCTRMEKLRIFN